MDGSESLRVSRSLLAEKVVKRLPGIWQSVSEDRDGVHHCALPRVQESL